MKNNPKMSKMAKKGMKSKGKGKMGGMMPGGKYPKKTKW